MNRYAPGSIWLTESWLIFATVVTKVVLFVVFFLIGLYLIKKFEIWLKKIKKNRKIKEDKKKQKEMYRKRYKKEIERANYCLKREVSRIDHEKKGTARVPNASGWRK